MSQDSLTTAQPKQESGLAIASLICGGLGFFFGIFTAIPAVICGHMALKQLKREPDVYNDSSRGYSIAGLILGYIWIGITVLVILFLVVIIIIGAAGVTH